MAKKLTPDDWLKIKTEYQFGEKSIRQIAGENGITDGAIRARIKSENWTQDLREQVIDIKKNIGDIAQVITHAQKPIVAQKIKTLFDTQLEAFGLVKDIAMTSLKIHRNLNVEIHNAAANKQQIAPYVGQAIGLLKLQGMDVSGSMKAIGIQEDRPKDKVNDVESDLSPSEAYQRLIKGE